MAIKFPDSDGFGNPGTPELSFENDIALEFTTDSASYSEYGDADHVSYTQTKRPHKLSQYFRNGNEVPDADANVNIPLIDNFPTAISFSDFYGAVNEITIEFIGQQYEINGTTYTANTNDTLNLFTIAELAAGSSPGNNITVPFVFKFDSDTVFNNSIKFGGTFSDITIENNGIIAGRGGHGQGSNQTYTKDNYGNSVTVHDGNAAIWIDSDQTKVEIVNLEKGFIAGGGNGGASRSHPDKTVGPLSDNGDEAFASGGYISGGGGGWNGGIGGRANAYAEARVDRPDAGEIVRPSSGFNAYTANTPNAFIVVNSRSVNGDGGFNGTIASRTGHAYYSGYSPTFSDTATNTAGSAGSGLNGGTSGGRSLSARTAQAKVVGNPEARATGKGGSGGSGGNGIGSDTAPHFQSSGSGTGAGGGNSIQFKTGTTIGTSTMTNDGRVYGNTDITIS